MPLEEEEEVEEVLPPEGSARTETCSPTSETRPGAGHQLLTGTPAHGTELSNATTPRTETYLEIPTGAGKNPP